MPPDQSPSPPPIPPFIAPPVRVLAYTFPVDNLRPGWITAMGVSSIIVGCWQMLSNMWSGSMALVFFIAGNFANTPTGPVDYVGPDGYLQSDRVVIIRAFNAKQSLTPSQQNQLDFFLMDVGQKHVPAVSAAASSAGEVADYTSANLSGEAGVDVETAGAAWFELPVGRLTLSDSAATFAPLDNSPPVTRSFSRSLADPADPSVLSPAEIQAVIDRVQAMSGSPLLPSQVKALQQQLGTNAKALVGSPPDMPTLLGQVSSVIPSQGSLVVDFQQAMLVIPTNGQASVISTPQQEAFPKIAVVPMVSLIVESALSGLLAIYLLVIGIVTLRNSIAGGRLHKIYAVSKILLTLIATAASWWAFHSAAANAVSVGITNSGGYIRGWGWLMSLLALIGGCAYPIALLCVLRIKQVREFYATPLAR